jgi:hypothetical protein
MKHLEVGMSPGAQGHGVQKAIAALKKSYPAYFLSLGEGDHPE